MGDMLIIKISTLSFSCETFSFSKDVYLKSMAILILSPHGVVSLLKAM